MREILFRGKTYNGEWIEGNFIDWGNHVQVYIFPLFDTADEEILLKDLVAKIDVAQQNIMNGVNDGEK